MIDSIGAAKTELLALLRTGNTPTVDGVTIVYGYEPFAGQAQKPVAVTVATEGITPTEYQLAVRIYQSVDIDAEAAATSLDTLIVAVDQAVGSTGRFGPSEWTVAIDPEIRALIATCILQVPREDYWSSTP